MKRFNSLALISTMFLWATPVLAATPGYISGLPSGSALTLSGVIAIIANAITMLLGLAVTITIGMIVYGGFKYATGDIKGGKEILYNAIIGLAVILGTGIIINTIARFATNPGSILY